MRRMEAPGVVAAAFAGVVLVLYSLLRLIMEMWGVPNTEGTPLFYFYGVMYAAGYMGALGGLVELHAQQVGRYGRLGSTGFILALAGTTLYVVHDRTCNGAGSPRGR